MEWTATVAEGERSKLRLRTKKKFLTAVKNEGICTKERERVSGTKVKRLRSNSMSRGEVSDKSSRRGRNAE